MEEINKEQGLQIELKESVADGVYSNMVVIAHSSTEFVCDFISLMPGVNKAQVKSRVIIAPEHAKRLLLSLQDNIRRYEANFGEIRITGPSSISHPSKNNMKGDA
ncbi:MAG: DUF3467 domain-containing protein [Bacteroidales bacterium]|nr:DUF3467 domain-containing protein [Bacteroidales bacterium]